MYALVSGLQTRLKSLFFIYAFEISKRAIK
jgi:hypothetical protein